MIAKLSLVKDLASLAEAFDSTVIVFSSVETLKASCKSLHGLDLLEKAAKADKNFLNSVSFLPVSDTHGIVAAPIGKISQEYDDVRVSAEAARKGIARARKAGSINPLLILDLPEIEGFENAWKVAVLGAYQEIYEQNDVLNYFQKIRNPLSLVKTIGVHATGSASSLVTAEHLRELEIIEAGRSVARDIGSPDPEVMAPLKIVEYLKSKFKDLPVKITVEDKEEEILKRYPLLHAVARASYKVKRHYPAVVKLEYLADDQSKVKDHLYFVGKGVTYDTGGADVKSHMRGMSRDKCGAAGVAGFVYSVALSKPAHVNVTAMLALVRNSIGSDSYVADEVILSRAGSRVLIGNTDAEGRMAMTDLLAESVEIAQKQKQEKPSVQQRLFTVATLTGHVIKAYGFYPACLDNGPARKVGVSKLLSTSGAAVGEPWEVSVLRNDDLKMVQPASNREDVIQCNTEPSSATPRGHYFPAVFMSVASGLDKYTLDNPDSSKRLAYTHLDIAGSAEEPGSSSGSLPRCTGSPVATLFKAFIGK
ncbi:hypothetical protein MP638_000040 [Amoeboaphelidium occidentale]|nr:hypothetical protein MP638_000040 [Amoeboaphelidium occidentale]